VNTPARCSEVSERTGEPLGATATHAEHWLLLETPGTWPRDVADGASLPEAARAAVRTWLEQTPASRLLFIRRPGRDRARTRRAFVVRASESSGGVRRIEVSAPEELGELDLARAGEVDPAPLVLICGHGTRDACCALRGTAVYGALAQRLEPDELWLSSHQGGHRFAANVLVLPLGIHLGRVTPDEAPHVVAQALDGRIVLERYRGRTAYPQEVQAGERVVRDVEGLDAVSDLRLVEADGDRARFRSRDGCEYTTLATRTDGPSVPASCGAEAETQSVSTARLVRPSSGA
jgi:hypothetical protein